MGHHAAAANARGVRAEGEVEAAARAGAQAGAAAATDGQGATASLAGGTAGTTGTAAAEVAGYYRYDASGTEAGDVVMAAQVMGEWSLAAIGAPGVLPPHQVKAALRTVHRLNVRAFSRHAAHRRRQLERVYGGGSGSGGGGNDITEPSLSEAPAAAATATAATAPAGDHLLMGAVNGALYPGGEPDASNLQSQEVWAGVSYALASHLMLSNLTTEVNPKPYFLNPTS